jgi:hypothetical protein
VVFPPAPDPLWDYRRPAIGAVLAAVSDMLGKYVERSKEGGGG